jgi:hypothetical protein
MDRNKIPLDIHFRSTIECAQSDFHVHGTFIINRAPILHRDLNYLQTDRNELLLDPCRLGVQLGAFNMISEPVVSLGQTMYLCCVEIKTSPNWPKQVSTWPTSCRSTIRAPKMSTFDANLAPIWVKINTITKQTETSIHLTHVSYEFQQVRPKWFPSLWYVRRKPCTYLRRD